ncbi:uncharacterized protein [Dendropsophus ebraccatus]|uniref:uncharacterized protein isoform X2 n=1 Tax=Dendropsophus ebraccatus TaxID=150705 RepID=UPI0038318BA3
MSSPVSDVNSHTHGCVHYRPCTYLSSAGPHMSPVQPDNQQCDYCSPPPAYETIDRLPPWNGENSQLNSIPTTPVWIQRRENNVPSTPDVSTIRPQYIAVAISPERSRRSTFSHQNPSRVASRTVDYKRWYRSYRPREFGIVLVVVSVVELSFGISLAVSYKNSNLKSLEYGVPFWVSVGHIFAGIMLIISWATTSICSLKYVLCISFLSSMATVIGLVFTSCDFNDLHCKSSQVSYCPNINIVT